MSGVARGISEVAGIVSTIAAFIPGGQVIAAAAAAVALVSGAVAQATQKPPPIRGSINKVMIGANMPVPYTMGRTYTGGAKVQDSSSGSNNVNRTQFFVGGVGGPIESFEQILGDFTAIDFAATAGGRIEGVAIGYYGADGGYLWANSRLGLLPDTALTPDPSRTAFTDWDSTAKLSGMPCWCLTMEFDEKGVRWASGIPQWGMVARWVKDYDPREDDTYPGGSGAQRFDDETTWQFGADGAGTVAQGENPALMALAYARGRFENGIKVVGIGFPKAAINIDRIVEWANLCDANGWKAGGTIYEAPGVSKWDNLKRIAQAGGAKPVFSGGVLDFVLNAPRVSLDTITTDDLADGELSIAAMTPWRARFNTFVARYRSEDHRWDYVQAGAVTSSTYVAEDGEEKTKEDQFDLVQNVDQAAQLGAYEIVNKREFGPIQLPLKPRLMGYKVGEALTINIPEAGLSGQLAIVTKRSPDPATGTVTLELTSETAAKHPFALGQVGVAPPTPSIVPPEDADAAVNGNSLTTAQISNLILTSTVNMMFFSIAPDGTVTITGMLADGNYNRIYSDKVVEVEPGTIATGAAVGDRVLIYYDQQDRSGGSVSYQALVLPGGSGQTTDAYATPDHPYRHYVCQGVVPGSGTTSGGSGAGFGGGTAGGGGGTVEP